MKVSIRAVVRGSVLAICGAQVLALFIGGLLPSEQAMRNECSTRPMILSDDFVPTTPGWPVIVDPDTITARSLAVGEGEHLEQASCSPWQDERGERQVVGLWYRTTGQRVGQLSREFGLARCLFPSGRVLDRIETETLPQSPPCWFPKREARVLFAGHGGRLYQFSFETGEAGESAAKGQPVPLGWLVKEVPEAPVEIGDLAWPSDPRLGGRLLASMRFPEWRSDGVALPGSRQLWWLRLNGSKTAVIAAGRLTESNSSSLERPVHQADERYPTVGVAANGSPILAYMVHRPGTKQAGWQVKVAPFELDPVTRAPRVRTEASRTLAQRCAPVAPAFSTSSERLLCLSYQPHAATRLRQLPIPNDKHTGTADPRRLSQALSGRIPPALVAGSREGVEISPNLLDN